MTTRSNATTNHHPGRGAGFKSLPKLLAILATVSLPGLSGGVSHADSGKLQFSTLLAPETVRVGSSRTVQFCLVNQGDAGLLIRSGEDDDHLTLTIRMGSGDADLELDGMGLACASEPPGWACALDILASSVTLTVGPSGPSVAVAAGETDCFALTGLHVNGEEGMSFATVEQSIHRSRADKLLNSILPVFKSSDGTTLHDDLGGVRPDQHHAYPVPTSGIVDAAVTGAKIAAGAVDTPALADGAVANAKLGASAVDGGKIADGSVETADLADGAVTGGKIADASVETADLANLAVDTGKLAKDAVTQEKLATGAVATVKLADHAVVTAKIADHAVGSQQVDSAAVQLRVNGSCPPDKKLIAIHPDGSVSCEPDPPLRIQSHKLKAAMCDHCFAQFAFRCSSGFRSIAAGGIWHELRVGLVEAGPDDALHAGDDWAFVEFIAPESGETVTVSTVCCQGCETSGFAPLAPSRMDAPAAGNAPAVASLRDLRQSLTASTGPAPGTRVCLRNPFGQGLALVRDAELLPAVSIQLRAIGALGEDDAVAGDGPFAVAAAAGWEADAVRDNGDLVLTMRPVETSAAALAPGEELCFELDGVAIDPDGAQSWSLFRPIEPADQGSDGVPRE